MSRQFRRALAIVVASAVFLQGAAGHASALNWTANRAVTQSRNALARHGLAISGTSRFHLAYAEATGGIQRVMYRRSTNRGATFRTPVTISSPDADYAFNPSISAQGPHLQIVWQEDRDDDTDMWLRRSSDHGATWKARQLMSSGGTAGAPTVVRDSSSRVVVAWTNRRNGDLVIRRSTNGGATFGSRKVVATTTNRPFGSSGPRDALPQLALGTGVMYLAYYSSGSTLKVRRSTNGGKSWSSASTIATDAYGAVDLSIAANGSVAGIGFARLTATNVFAMVRRTATKGVSWTAPVILSGKSKPPSFPPKLQISGSTWRAAFERCGGDSCGTSKVVYRQSSNGGASWGSEMVASKTDRPFAFPGGVARVGGTLGILYTDSDPDVLDSDVFLRLGS
jgi:hypothetical protein